MSRLQRMRDKAELQRSAEAKFMADILRNGDDHKVAARVRSYRVSRSHDLLLLFLCGCCR